MSKFPNLREIIIDTYEKPIRKGPNGEEYWECQIVKNEMSQLGFFICLKEDEKYKLFNLIASNLNAGLCSHWIEHEPIIIGNDIWDLYDQMGKKQIFRKREDGLGYYHYL